MFEGGVHDACCRLYHTFAYTIALHSSHFGAARGYGCTYIKDVTCSFDSDDRSISTILAMQNPFYRRMTASGLYVFCV